MAKYLNIDIANIYSDELLVKYKSGVLYTPNVDHLVNLQKDKEFYEAYKQADWLICDSKIIFFLSKFTSNPIKETIPGSTFFRRYYEYNANNNAVKIFLLGAAPGVAELARKKINHKIGREIVIEAYSPSFGFEKNEKECKSIIDLINNSGATVLAVGVGSPKQEKWIFKYRNQLLDVKSVMAIGATIDFEAGTLSRAPILLQKYGLEWLFRLFKEPRRLWKRYLLDDMKLFYYHLKFVIGIYKNPFDKS